MYRPRLKGGKRMAGCCTPGGGSVALRSTDVLRFANKMLPAEFEDGHIAGGPDVIYVVPPLRALIGRRAIRMWLATPLRRR